MLDFPTTLLSNATFLTHILDTTQTGVVVLQPVVDERLRVIDFTFSYVNPTARHIYDQSHQQLVDQETSFLDLFPYAKTIGLFDAFVQVMHTGQTYHNPELVYAWDGVNGWFDVQVSRVENHLVVTLLDVTQLKVNQLEQQEQTDFLQGLLQISPSGIIVYEAIRSLSSNHFGEEKTGGEIVDFRTVFCNKAYESIFTQSAGYINQSTFRQRFDDKIYQDLFTVYVQLTETGNSIKLERYYTHLNKWLNVSGIKWRDGFLLVIDDVSERKEAESVQHNQALELQRVNQELQRLNENLMEFSSVASHDLQEPLRKIQQFGDILSDQYAADLGSQGLDLLHRMQASSVRMSALIRDLLDYSRLSRQPEMVRQHGLNQIVDEVLTALELVVAEKRAVVEVAPLGTLAGDATQLTQVFQNLLTNALKFSKHNNPPHIRISSESVGLADLPDRFQPSPGHDLFCAIRVTDNGIGFDPQQAERIFGTFQRLHGRGEYPGTGIGLAIVRKIVDNHGGYIMAQSTPGEGAVFTIYLPIITPGAEPISN